MDYQLIPLAHEHLGQAAEIERLCFSDPWSEKMLAEHLANPCSLTLAAVGDTGRLLGYVGLLAVVDEGYITNVAVRPDCRRQGGGGGLLGAPGGPGKGRGAGFPPPGGRPFGLSAMVHKTGRRSAPPHTDISSFIGETPRGWFAPASRPSAARTPRGKRGAAGC